MKPSEIYFAAASAALNALPPESRALIERRDALERAWGAAGYKGDVPAELIAAGAAIKADPLAAAAITIRVLGNDAFMAERANSPQ